MTENATENQVQQQTQQISDKELNFRKLEQRYQAELMAERQKREEAERRIQEHSQREQQKHVEDEEDDAEPFVDHKKLNKTLSKFGQSTKSEIERAMEIAKKSAKEELRREMWLENNPDFYEVLQHADKFAQKSPKLAEAILAMPEGFERQKLVYQNIKEMGIDKPEQLQKPIQDTIDANRRSPYYQPSGVGTAPYGMSGDFSSAGQKNAYDKMKELQARLRLG